MLPAQYRWLEAEPGPRMIIEALKEYGTLEAPGDADNPKIVGWQRELQAAGFGRDYGGFYDADAIPWCGLFMAVIALRANRERRPERDPPKRYLSALAWAAFGRPIPKGAAALGDVLVFKRKGGGHVGLSIGQDSPNKNLASAFHVLGGNQSDRVSITRLSRNRLVAVRRPAYRAQPANVRLIPLTASGSLSVNEA
jgi:uncharacterized protein (TIGR02594 family)